MAPVFDKYLLIYVWNRYHALDWIVLSLLLHISAIVTVTVDPYCRPFSWSDPSIGYPQHADTFPNYSLVLMVIGALLFYPLFIVFLTKPLQNLLGEPLSLYHLNYTGGDVGGSGAALAAGAQREIPQSPLRMRDVQVRVGPIYPWIKAQLWATGIETFVTALLKIYAGRLRPDYLARLAAAGYTASTSTIPNPLEDPQYFCDLMSAHPELKEGRLSFPSGHSSTSFAVFVMLTFFFFAHLRPFARQSSLTRLFICLLPLSVSLLCAVSRTRDFKHNFSDIVAGAIIGSTAACIAFTGSFRQVGGAAYIFYSRTDSDVEYQQLREPPGFVVERMSGYHSVDSPAFRANPASSVVVIDGNSGGGNSNNNNSSSGTAAAAAGGSTTAVSFSNTISGSPPPSSAPPLTERRLNEDPAAVPWI